MRGQRGDERRRIIVQMLRQADGPILGSELAEHFGVSRQVLVQDMAILRATGVEIIATPRGYLLRSTTSLMHRETLHTRHDRSAEIEELTILVDLGIQVLDVQIDHPVYGTLVVDLGINSRQDISDYVDHLERTASGPLQELTAGHHRHTVQASRPDLLTKAREELTRRGYLRS